MAIWSSGSVGPTAPGSSFGAVVTLRLPRYKEKVRAIRDRYLTCP